MRAATRSRTGTCRTSTKSIRYGATVTRPGSRTTPSTCSGCACRSACRCASSRASTWRPNGCRGARPPSACSPGATARPSSRSLEGTPDMPASRSLTVVTYNIHKGLSQFNRRLVLHEIRDRLGSLDADVAFLQEVQGRHEKNAHRHVTWPEKSQHEFLCRDGGHSVYGMNA